LDGETGTLNNFAEIAHSVPYSRSPSSPVIPKYEGRDRRTTNEKQTFSLLSKKKKQGENHYTKMWNRK
jgi:hypothetical protein